MHRPFPTCLCRLSYRSTCTHHGDPFQRGTEDADCAINDYSIENLHPSNWASQPAIVFVLPPLLPTHTVGSHGDNQVGMGNAIQEVGDLLGTLGFVNLNEQSFVHVVAMMTLAR